MKVFNLINDKVITVFIVSMVTLIAFSSFLSHVDKDKIVKEKSVETLDLVQDRTKDQALTRRVIVYDNMTMSELSAKLNRSMKDTIAGKGELLASYSLEKGVDPYVALSIILLESGCNSGRCSGLTRNCYNVGGQKGSPGCNGGSYKAFSNIDEGIKSFVDNLATYYARGLNTPEKMNSRYAESQVWAQKVRSYMSSISRK